MRGRRSFFATACLASFLFAGCDSYSLLDSFTVGGTELTWNISSTTLQPGEKTDLNPTGGTAPYSWILVEGDLFYQDSVNKLGSVNDNKYTAGNSIGTVTIQLWDSKNNMKEAVVTVVPPAPTNLTVTKSGTGSLTVAWTYTNTEYISGFKLFRTVNGAESTEITVTGNTITSVTQTGLIKPNTYTYYLAAVAVSPAGVTYRLPTTVQAVNIPD